MTDKLRASTNDPAAPDSDQANAEIRMRRALGLESLSEGAGVGRSGNSVALYRSRNSSGSPVNRLAEARSALAAESAAREKAELLLREVETALREADTRRGHAEVARDEALTALAAERRAREAAEEQVRTLTTPRADEPDPAPAIAAPKRRGRPPGSGKKAGLPAAAQPNGAPSNDAPVEWWVPGWKSQFRQAG